MKTYNRHCVTYYGNRRQLTRFVYQLMKRNIQATDFKPLYILKKYCRWFPNECSVIVFSDNTYGIRNNRQPIADNEVCFQAKNYKEALNTLTIKFNF